MSGLYTQSGVGCMREKIGFIWSCAEMSQADAVCVARNEAGVKQDLARNELGFILVVCNDACKLN